MASIAYNKRKGREWENAVALVAQATGFPHAERRVKKGRYDEGDITGMAHVVLECKNGRSVSPGQAVDEARVEGENAEALIYAAAKKRERKPPERGFFLTDLDHGLLIVRAALVAVSDHGPGVLRADR